MTTPKASGPLWTILDKRRRMNIVAAQYPLSSFSEEAQEEAVPCRLIPGHGKVVPLALVVGILQAHREDTDMHTYNDCATCKAIDAAVKGAI